MRRRRFIGPGACPGLSGASARGALATAWGEPLDCASRNDRHFPAVRCREMLALCDASIEQVLVSLWTGVSFPRFFKLNLRV